MLVKTMLEMPINEFLEIPVHRQKVGYNTIAYRRVGKGPALLCIHGWPLNSATYRFLLPELQKHFTCILPDSPGLGETEWQRKEDLHFQAQADGFQNFMSALGIDSYHVIAHDTGATIARLLAAKDASPVKSLIIMNTEIMNHRPPLLPFYQLLLNLPGSAWLFAQLMRSKLYVRSMLGFGKVFLDKQKMDDTFISQNVEPIVKDTKRRAGMINYFRGIDWQVVDGIDQTHREIKAPVKMIWGKQDFFFAVEQGRRLVGLSPKCHGIAEIEGAGLLPHEEQPEAVFAAAAKFWQDIGAFPEEVELVEQTARAS